MKTNIISYNDNGQHHGYWEIYYPNGNIKSKGNYHNGLQSGYWEYYWDNANAIINYKGNYIHGEKSGYWERYYSNGVLDYKIYYII